MGHSESSFKLRLKKAGFGGDKPPGATTTPIEDELLRTQDDFGIEHAGPLAGHQPGILAVQGDRFLVTAGPTLVEPEEGSCQVTLDWLGLLLGDQLGYFLLWLKFADEAVRSAGGRLGHVLILAGPPQSGKSRLQELTITPVLGGRVAKAHLHISGASSFNSEWFKGEHLVGEDEVSSTKYENRQKMLDFFKAIAANKVHQYHAKGAEAMTLEPVWRCSYSLNDEPENLRTLPPITSSVRDKISLLHVDKVDDWPMPVDTDGGYRAFKERIREELPAFVWHLQNRVKAPVEGDYNFDKRYGVRAEQNQTLLAMLNEQSPEAHLESLIDAIYYGQGEPHTAKKKLSNEILADLLEHPKYASQVNKHFGSGPLIGGYMKRLAEQNPNRYSKEKGRANRTFWSIKPPPTDEWLGGEGKRQGCPQDPPQPASALI